VFGFVVATGGLVLAWVVPVAAVMPPLHVLAAVLPAVALAGLAARGGLGWRETGCRPTWRQVFVAVGFAMAVATMLSSVAETLVDGGIMAAFLASENAFENVATSRDLRHVAENFELFLGDRESWRQLCSPLQWCRPWWRKRSRAWACVWCSRLTPRSARPSCWEWWQGRPSALSRPSSTGLAGWAAPTPTGGL
jgi:hypothetical protein